MKSRRRLPCRALIALVAGWVLLMGAGIRAETRAVIAAGLGGNEDYEQEFQRHANRLAGRLKEVTEDVTLLLGDSAGRATVETALGALAARLQPDDNLVFVFIGHGTYDGERFRFNVPGADFTAEDLAGWLDRMVVSNQLIVITGASSGAVQEVLASPRRTVITGTRSGDQRNATVFGQFFTAALEDEAADVDKDRRITALEAYQYAESAIVSYYDRAGEMTVENPRTSGPDPLLTLALLESPPQLNPADRHLLALRESLELEIARLRAARDSYTQDDYFSELQRLLLELAVVQQQLEGAADTSASTDGVDSP